MREVIQQLVELGPLPDSVLASEDLVRLESYQERLARIEPPVTDEEAGELLKLFGPDECFGLAWALLHLIESAPGWPVPDALMPSDNPWTRLLRERADRATETGM